VRKAGNGKASSALSDADLGSDAEAMQKDCSRQEIRRSGNAFSAAIEGEKA
jgi:hypothetical protein